MKGLSTLSCSSSIERDLANGITILCDRYAFSGVAFSASKPNLSYEWCKAPDISLPAPDLVIFLDIEPEVARLRGGYGDERYEKEEVQKKVRSIFRQIETDSKNLQWVTVNAAQSLEEVEGRIREVVKEYEDGVKAEIGRLWVD